MGYEKCGRTEKYPYDMWFDDKPHTLEAGVHWSSTLSREAFVRALRIAAARRGLRLQATAMGLRRVYIQTSVATEKGL